MSVRRQFHFLSVDSSTWKCDKERHTERETERHREIYAQIDYHKEFRALGGTLPKEYDCCAWALGGSDVSLRSAAFDSNCLKSHAASLRSIVIVLKVVAAKTNWREKTYGIRV